MKVLEPLEGYVQQALEHFEEVDGAREEVLKLSREVIRKCARSIQSVHRGEIEEARAGLTEARRLAGRLESLASSYRELTNAGFVIDALKELAEGATFFAVVQGEPLPGPGELQVGFAAWLNGLAECVGELRRYALDSLREGQLERAVLALEAMEELYSQLMEVHYPDALLHGLRHRTDAARGMIERTRGEVSNAVQQARLEEQLKRTREQITGEGRQEDA